MVSSNGNICSKLAWGVASIGFAHVNDALTLTYRRWGSGSTGAGVGIGMQMRAGDTTVVRLSGDTVGNLKLGFAGADLAATVGHVFVPGGAGVPTGIPVGQNASNVALFGDTTNRNMYFYAGGWRRLANIQSDGSLQLEGNGVSNVAVVANNGNLRLGSAVGSAKASTDTTGWPMMPSVAGTPTGVPQNESVNSASFTWDRTNKRLCIRDQPTNAWVCFAGTGASATVSASITGGGSCGGSVSVLGSWSNMRVTLITGTGPGCSVPGDDVFQVVRGTACGSSGVPVCNISPADDVSPPLTWNGPSGSGTTRIARTPSYGSTLSVSTTYYYDIRCGCTTD